MTAATGPEELLVTWLRKNVTLAAEPIDISETSIDVDDGTLFVGNDVILIDDEQMLVTDVVANTLTVERAYNSSVAATHADNAEIGLWKRRRFKLQVPLQPQAVDGFSGKVTIGPYNIDSNDILSSWNIMDLSGGHGIENHDEGVTDNRYRFGNLYTRFPGQWSKPYQISTTTLGTGRIRWLGDQYYNGTTYRMADSGAVLYQNTTSRGALTGAAYGLGVSWGGTAAQALFYIPQSASGYSTFDPSTNTLTNNNGGGDPDARSFLVWDEKLLVLDKDGYIWYATTAAATTTFTHYTLGGNNVRIDPAFEPYRLHAFYNRTGDQVPYVITRENVWGFDADTPRFYQIPDFEGQHPRFGRASCVWRGKLYVSSGMSVLEFDGEVIRTTMGLDRDDGLPYNYSDHVISLTPTQNALYALVHGISFFGDTYHSVHEYTGFGWHCIFTEINANVPQTIVSSSAGDTYHLYWGLSNAGTIYSQELPVAFTNPREAIEAGGVLMGDRTDPVVIDFTDYFEEFFYLETGRFDANMAGYRKIANAVEMDVRSIDERLADFTDTPIEAIRLYYRVDEDTDWTLMYHSDGAAPSSTTITTPGHHVFQFGPYDPDGTYIGVDFETIEFRITLTGLIPVPYIQSTSAVIRSLSFSFLKLMNPSLAWTANLDLRDDYHDASPQVLLDELTELRTLPRFFSIQHRDRIYRSRMTGMQTSEEGGNDERATARCSFIEVPFVLGIASE